MTRQSDKKYVSDIITKEEINKWRVGDVIYVDAPTGSGKSHFIKYDLYEKAKSEGKKILMLIHRINCVDQFKKELELVGKLDSNVIEIKTYQAIEARERAGVIFDFSEYDYLVVDEAHYFCGTDASFNYYTDMSLNTILEQEYTIKILMTATGKKIKRFLNENKGVSTNNYHIAPNFEHIKQLTFFKDEVFYEEFIESVINKNEKAIIFVNDTELAFRLHFKYRFNTLFNCSKSNNFYGYVDEKKIDKMLEEEMFHENVLITTSVLDSGVNIKDENLNNIVININEFEVIVQCLGRKRILSANDHLNLYIQDYNNRQFNGMAKNMRNKLDKADYLARHGEELYVLRYGRYKDGSIDESLLYDEYNSDRLNKKINQLMYFRASNRLYELKSFMKIGYKEYISRALGIDSYKYRDKERKINTVEEYLKSIVGDILFSEGREELIKTIDLRDSNNRQQRSIGVFNSYFEENDIDYYIRVKIVNKTIDGKRVRENCWVVTML